MRPNSQPLPLAGATILFVSRDPVLHQHAGSTTYALGFLRLLQAQGAVVHLLSTTAYSRSPRLLFRVRVAPPAAVRVHLPGYRRVGPWYVRPLPLKPWARALARACTRGSFLDPVRKFLEGLYGDRLYTAAWDLPPPPPAETELVISYAQRLGASSVLANYCHWGPVLADARLSGQRTAILMHDLLSARTERFGTRGLPLDMPPLSHAEEINLLSCAHTAFAAQRTEAHEIRQQTRAKVVLTPVVLRPRALPEAAQIPGRCLFVGSNIPPNQATMDFLLRSVWPAVRARVPNATLAIVGTVSGYVQLHCADCLGEASGIQLHGLVPDLEPEYAQAEVCLIPLVLGTGIKIKLLEALGFGKATVSTTTGIQGLERWATGAVEVADHPAAFAKAVVRLLIDRALRRERACNALHLAQSHLSEQQVLSDELRAAFLPESDPAVEKTQPSPPLASSACTEHIAKALA